MSTHSLERVGVALVGTGLSAVLLWAVLRGLDLDATAVWSAVAFGIGGTLWLSPRLPTALDGSLRRHPTFAVLWLVLGLCAVAATGRLATFMVDETRAERSMLPFDEFYVHHSCLSAHYESARLQRQGVANVYERTNYEGPAGEPKFLRSFVVDVFIYPPPFLLLSRLALALSEDFTAWRAIWFGLEGAVTIVGLLAVALSCPGRTRHRALLLTPVVWLSLPLLTTLQFGNFHLAAISGAMLAMLALERGQHALGGSLLAGLALAKVFPGVLVLLLVFSRQWRSVRWTAVFIVVWLGVAWVVLGNAPFDAMLTYNLPRLASGAAVETQFLHPDGIAASHAVFGFVQKLELLGVPGASRSVAATVSWWYTGVLVAFAWLGARAVRLESSRSPLVWLALLQLASIRSPFTPDTYALFPILWLLVLLLARAEWPSRRSTVLIALVPVANYIVPTVPIMPVQALLLLSLILQVAFFSVCASVVVSPSRSVRTDAPV